MHVGCGWRAAWAKRGGNYGLVKLNDSTIREFGSSCKKDHVRGSVGVVQVMHNAMWPARAHARAICVCCAGHFRSVSRQSKNARGSKPATVRQGAGLAHPMPFHLGVWGQQTPHALFTSFDVAAAACARLSRCCGVCRSLLAAHSSSRPRHSCQCWCCESACRPAAAQIGCVCVCGCWLVCVSALVGDRARAAAALCAVTHGVTCGQQKTNPPLRAIHSAFMPWQPIPHVSASALW